MEFCTHVQSCRLHFRDGDVYSALRDCYTTLILDPDHLKAHFRLARCLYLLNQHAEARISLDMFKVRFRHHCSALRVNANPFRF